MEDTIYGWRVKVNGEWIAFHVGNSKNILLTWKDDVPPPEALGSLANCYKAIGYFVQEKNIVENPKIELEAVTHTQYNREQGSRTIRSVVCESTIFFTKDEILSLVKDELEKRLNES